MCYRGRNPIGQLEIRVFLDMNKRKPEIGEHNQVDILNKKTYEQKIFDCKLKMVSKNSKLYIDSS